MSENNATRRRLMQGALATIGLNGIAPLLAPGIFSGIARAAAASAAANDRILVVLEMSGGNDGLNTVVPYGDDAYYRLRPAIGIREKQLRKLDAMHGLNPGMSGFERLWKDGQLAIVHGCGYDNPSFSHFTSMAYWHTATPNSGADTGWFGRLADRMSPQPKPNFLINVDAAQSLAVTSRVHTPVVFDDPEKFMREGLQQQRALLDQVPDAANGNASRAFLNDVARSARDASSLVRQAWHAYKSPVDYGINPLGLNKVAACIAASLPTRLYYTAYRNNAFDTHVQQVDLHQRLLTYTADAVLAFLRDMERLGQADRVAVLAFSEFGRRAKENASLGTDHGTANVMFFAGKGVRGGHYGERSSLAALDAGDNLVHTADFRRSYATAIDGWLRLGASQDVLRGRFQPFDIFA
ncbi:MAG TPA: DUF1501 domain-containing protein [Rhodocyclaceae bacterium]|nr:DUF1501 domain-containing protein [Rhodocyclaceae bacterium]HMV54345.1 DUF1501 domain-containing protein [Rhodocyclaceae bacterium]HMZ84028.1 DUF1501 domain-containing protein [Rhodocyclaceae bacterium]HNA03638.1 DUF1501 domain-containing protein [Rhodocyclaceae bacterium]HNB78774.1 DUF1501 domain-containing protein [Rhodocyclaceae bacterium]